jgi:hypothetical protein
LYIIKNLKYIEKNVIYLDKTELEVEKEFTEKNIFNKLLLKYKMLFSIDNPKFEPSLVNVSKSQMNELKQMLINYEHMPLNTHQKRILDATIKTISKSMSVFSMRTDLGFCNYKTFKEFVEEEYNFSGSFASKLVSNYNLFINEYDLDETIAKQIGLDKLNMVKPMLKDATKTEATEWIEKAQMVPTAELRDEIKEIRERNKEKNKTSKEIFVEQYLERMVTAFNCSKKELEFKLALYFQDEDIEEIKDIVSKKQNRYEDLN